jgi:hypothetical protein
MHVLYVSDSVDELIYAREDWSDLTGEGENRYWGWGLDPEAAPEQQPGPPATPRPTEEQEWERISGEAIELPTRWLGVLSGQEYSVDTLGTVKNEWGTTMVNAQGVDAMVQAVRGRPGGRFRVTPAHRLVLVSHEGTDGIEFMVAGQLAESFRAVEENLDVELGDLDLALLSPGDEYPGPATNEGGDYQLRMKRGGVIERKAGRGAEFALTDGADRADLVENAKRLLDAWREAVGRGIPFSVNDLGDAWYEAGGERRFLTRVVGGFAWPSDEQGTD